MQDVYFFLSQVLDANRAILICLQFSDSYDKFDFTGALGANDNRAASCLVDFHDFPIK